MSSEEFTDWQAAYRIAPWGEHLADVHFAQLNATVCNASGNFKSPRETRSFLLLKDPSPKTSLSASARKYLKRPKRGNRRNSHR
ncbi:MAG TPA: hypothetical protein PLX85_00220 [Dehalococcoidia bacterium]|nr:hypothetical protein [Dehalococcoidia bacterium]